MYANSYCTIMYYYCVYTGRMLEYNKSFSGLIK